MKTLQLSHLQPRIGQFFSLQQGRVGQYRSPRILTIRQPFRSHPDMHYLGFDRRQQALRFSMWLARQGYRFELHQNGWTPYPYEICLQSSLPISRLIQTLADAG